MTMKATALLRALSVSRRLAGFFHAPHQGNVLATYDRSCYLNLDGQIVALVTPALLNGPLHIVVDTDTWCDRVTAGATTTSTPRTLRIDGGIEVGLHAAAVWDAALRPWPEEHVRTLHGHVRTLQKLLDTDAPEGGLSRAATRENVATTALETVAAPAMADLAQGLQRRDVHLVGRAAGALAGLGPGLTPSGDDVLAGCLLTFAVLRTDDSHGMRQAIVSAVRDRTTRLSRAYIEAAARAEASEAWHRLVDALAANDTGRIAGAARGVMAFGETSGSDMLAGFVLAVNALLA